MANRGLPSLSKPRRAVGRVASLIALSAALAGQLAACDDPLPAFANPPPYDASVDPDGGGDEDGG
jgi:hypothetical protein